MPLDTLNNLATLGEQRTKINAVIVETNTQESEIEDLQGRMTVAENNVAELSNRFDTLQQAIDAVTANPELYAMVHVADNDYEVIDQTTSTADGINYINAGTKQLKNLIYLQSPDFSEFSDVNPKRHLTQFSSTATPTVVFMGDSLFTFAADSLAGIASLPMMIEERITTHNPDLAINFVNRAIGGKTYNAANGVPNSVAGYEDWYTDPMRPWLDYIEDEAPDLLFLSFGMNDRDNFDPVSLNEIVAKVNAWAKIPDIIFCTCMVPTTNITTNYPDFGTPEQQKGRNTVSSYVRTYAKKNNHGLIDVNRAFNVVREGYDICNQAFYSVFEDQDISATGSYVLENSTSGFKVKGSVDGDATFIDDAFTNNTVAVQIGNGTSDIVHIRKISDKFRIDFFDSSGTFYERINTGVDVPTSSFKVIVEVFNDTFIFKILEGRNEAYLAKSKLIRRGGPFTLKFGYSNGAFATGPFSTLDLDQTLDATYKRTMSNDEFWGGPAEDGNTKLPYGGNGLNHPTSIGARSVYVPSLQGCDFQSTI